MSNQKKSSASLAKKAAKMETDPFVSHLSLDRKCSCRSSVTRITTGACC